MQIERVPLEHLCCDNDDNAIKISLMDVRAANSIFVNRIQQTLKEFYHVDAPKEEQAWITQTSR